MCVYDKSVRSSVVQYIRYTSIKFTLLRNTVLKLMADWFSIRESHFIDGLMQD